MTATGRFLWAYATWDGNADTIATMAYAVAPASRMFDTIAPIACRAKGGLTALVSGLVKAIHAPELGNGPIYVVGPAAWVTRGNLCAFAAPLETQLSLTTLDTDGLLVWAESWGLPALPPVVMGDDADAGEVLRQSMIRARVVREWMGQRALFPVKVKL